MHINYQLIYCAHISVLMPRLVTKILIKTGFYKEIRNQIWKVELKTLVFLSLS